MDEIKPNSMVIITDAYGHEHEVEALSGVERGRDMLIVWVNTPLKRGGYEPTPWPADAVRAKGAA